MKHLLLTIVLSIVFLLPIYTSKDLKSWKQTGYVFSKAPEWTSGSFWASEYYQIGNTYYLYYTARRKSDGHSFIEVALYVKENTILPLAKSVDTVTGNTRFNITCYVFESAVIPATLYEDDGVSNDYKKGNSSVTTLQWKNKKGAVARSKKEPSRYRVVKWKLVP